MLILRSVALALLILGMGTVAASSTGVEYFVPGSGMPLACVNGGSSGATTTANAGAACFRAFGRIEATVRLDSAVPLISHIGAHIAFYSDAHGVLSEGSFCGTTPIRTPKDTDWVIVWAKTIPGCSTGAQLAKATMTS